jgi:uroporphyrinogen decarboxylase
MAEMTSRECVLTALEHPEPDRLPFDVGITLVACHNMCRYPGLPVVEPTVCDSVQGLALPDDVVECLGVDVRSLFLQPAQGQANPGPAT